MINKKWLFIFIFVSLLIMPVLGVDVELSHIDTVTNLGFAESNTPSYYSVLSFANYTASAPLLTSIVQNDIPFYLNSNDAELSGSEIVPLYHEYSGGVFELVGNVTATWSCDGSVKSWANTCDFTFDVLDLNPTPAQTIANDDRIALGASYGWLWDWSHSSAPDFAWMGWNSASVNSRTGYNDYTVNFGGTPDGDYVGDISSYGEGVSTTPRTITVNVKNLAGQVLEGQPVDVTLNDMSGSGVGYTDANGNYTTTLNVGTNTSTHIQLLSHGIYEQLDWDFNFDSTPWYAQLIMFQASPSGTYRNITYHLQDDSAVSLSGVWVTHITSPSSQRSEYTDINGNANFTNVPVVDNSANYQAYKNGYYQSYNSFAFSTNLYKVITLYPSSGAPPTSTPTPIITSVPYDTWSLQAYYDSISLGENVALIASNSNPLKETNVGGLNHALYYEKAPNNVVKLVGVYRYNATSSNWDYRPNNSVPYQYSAAYDITQLTTKPTMGGLYEYEIRTYDINSVSMGSAKCNVLVAGAGGATGESLTMVLQAQDQLIGSHLSNYQMNITDDNTGITTEFGNVVYDYSMGLPRGSSFTLKASKTGYIDGTYTFIVPTQTDIIAGDFGAIATVNLFPLGSLSAGNTSVSVHIYDAETYYPLGNVLVTISGDGITNSPRYTGSSGESAYFLIPQNTLYTVLAEKEGYCSVSDTKSSGIDASQYVPLFMKYGACTGTTPTPTPTINQTVTPTITPIGGYGGTTGLNASVCAVLPANATYIDILKNQMACNGIKDELGQNLALAMLIMLFGGLILGKVGKGIGVIAGVVAGAVVSMVMGFLPFWVVIVLIIIGGIIFSVKIFGSQQ